MATTVRDIFKKAMSLADSLNNSGQAVTGDNLEYQNRTPDIINLLQSELAAKGKLFNLKDYPYEERGIWKSFDLPSDFDIATNIVIFDKGNAYRSVQYYIDDKEVEDDVTGEITIVKTINFKSDKTGVIKMQYIPNPVEVTNIDDVVSLSDMVCRNVIPWGLAAALFLDENKSFASYCQQKYEENKDVANSRLLPNVLEEIEDPYTDIYDRGY